MNGNIGVGKTTFVNYVRALAFEKNHFTTIAEIGIQHDWNSEDFMQVTLSAVYTSINRIKGIRNKFDKEFLEKLDVYFGTYRGSSQGISGGVATISVGGEKGISYGAPAFNSFVMKDTLKEIVENLKKIGYVGMTIHYNNLELLNDKDEKNIIKLFNGIRDFLQTEGVHFIFVGDMTVSDMLQKVPRVDDIFYGPPVHMESFSFQDICSILDKRIKELSIGGKMTSEKPYSDEAIETLYKLYSGNVRAILKSLTTAITALSVENKPIKLTPVPMGRALRRIAEERYVSKLNQTEIKVLRQIIIKKETTNKLISEALRMKPQNISNAITTLRQYNCIRLSRVEGRARYYVPSPEIRWLFFDVSTDGQKLLREFVSI
ncbi:hypothetical protein COV61_05430 [Candidatus Micrarchaeota archaeon CG11_big_fil_rev_8_21_14_0_20_47_5]|nr:MAG: hypothetical protein COV61_05430 [Candidatus Micrarchaeota archaeon CG11_big_fil_rev_8_21_14_0_20_47_5]